MAPSSMAPNTTVRPTAGAAVSRPTPRLDAEWIPIPELARRINMSKEAVCRLARVGQLPGAIQMGRRYVVNYHADVEVSAGRSSPPTPDDPGSPKHGHTPAW